MPLVTFFCALQFSNAAGVSLPYRSWPNFRLVSDFCTSTFITKMSFLTRSALLAGSSLKQGAKVSQIPSGTLEVSVKNGENHREKWKWKNSEKKRLFNHHSPWVGSNDTIFRVVYRAVYLKKQLMMLSESHNNEWRRWNSVTICVDNPRNHLMMRNAKNNHKSIGVGAK